MTIGSNSVSVYSLGLSASSSSLSCAAVIGRRLSPCHAHFFSWLRKPSSFFQDVQRPFILAGVMQTPSSATSVGQDTGMAWSSWGVGSSSAYGSNGVILLSA